MSRVLGVAVDHHDRAAALAVDGVIVAAAQEECFMPRRHEAGLPANAIRYGLAAAAHRSMNSMLRSACDPSRWRCRSGRRRSCSEVAAEPRAGRRLGAAMDRIPVLLFCEYHLSHAASAFQPSLFERAAVGPSGLHTLGSGPKADRTERLKAEYSCPQTVGPTDLPTFGPALLMLDFLRDLWDFMRVRKKLWLLPLVVILVLLGGLVVASQQSALVAFIYTLF